MLQLSIYFVVAITITITILASTTPQASRFQRVGKPWLLSFLSGKNSMTFTADVHVKHGFDKVIKKTGKPFVMTWWGADTVMLPTKYLVDLQRADPDSLSFAQTMNDAFVLYATMGPNNSHGLMVDIVRKGINTRLRKLMPLANEECEHAFAQEIGAPNSWTEFGTATLVSKIMQRTTGRIFVGQRLCRCDSYLSAASRFANSTFINGLVVSMLPLGPFRHILAYPISIFHKFNVWKACNQLRHEVEARTTRWKANDQTDGESSTDEPLDAIDWALDLTKDDNSQDRVEKLVVTLLSLTWAGGPPTSSLVTNMIFQVLFEPQYLDPLRSEAELMFSTHGYTDQALNGMSLMDSFIRELNRLYPTGAVSCARTVMDSHGFKFHDGLELETGTRIAVPTFAIHTDADIYDDPQKFDGFRFHRSREASGSGDAGEKKAGSASTVSDINLAFGFGRHACVGRFLAVRLAKLVFGKLILDYDLKWEDVKTRPPGLSLNAQLAPNQSQTIWLKKRTAI